MEAEDDLKQVIVVRADLKMRRGKEVAQGAHASMAFITRRLSQSDADHHFRDVHLSDDELEWLDTSFKKVTVRVDSEHELMEIAHKAKRAGVECHVVTDSGHTEFGGVPTVTCLALGPDRASRIDPLTGHLRLY